MHCSIRVGRYILRGSSIHSVPSSHSNGGSGIELVGTKFHGLLACLHQLSYMHAIRFLAPYLQLVFVVVDDASYDDD